MSSHGEEEGGSSKWIYFIGATIILLWVYGQLYLGAGLTDKTPEEVLSESPEEALGDGTSVHTIERTPDADIVSTPNTQIDDSTAEIARLKQEIAQLQSQNTPARRVGDTAGAVSPDVDVVLKEGEHGTVRFLNEKGQVIQVYRY